METRQHHVGVPQTISLHLPGLTEISVIRNTTVSTWMTVLITMQVTPIQWETKAWLEMHPIIFSIISSVHLFRQRDNSNTLHFQMDSQIEADRSVHRSIHLLDQSMSMLSPI